MNIFPPRAHDICTIMYTSGTSGDPKGVVLSHENIAALVRGMDLFMEQFEDKVYLMLKPLANCYTISLECVWSFKKKKKKMI